MFFIFTTIWLSLFVVLYWKYPKHRREMQWAGGLSVPLMLFWSTPHVVLIEEPLAELINLALRISFGFFFTAIASLGVELYFYEHLKLTAHPHRTKLKQIILGPLAFLFSVLIMRFSIIFSLLFGFFAEMLVLAYHRKKLFFEAVVSGFLMGIIYLMIFVFIRKLAPDNGFSLLSINFTEFEIYGFPVEELLLVFGYGMLWGPLYQGVK